MVSTIDAVRALRSITEPPPEIEVRWDDRMGEVGIIHNGLLIIAQHVNDSGMWSMDCNIPLNNGDILDEIWISGATRTVHIRQHNKMTTSLSQYKYADNH